MSFFTGCTSLVVDETTEFVVGNWDSRHSGVSGGPQGEGPQGGRSQGALGNELRGGSFEGPLGGPVGPRGGPLGHLGAHPGGLDPQKIGRVLTVAVSELGEHVKSGGEMLWRSAVSAAGHALASSPTAGSGVVSLGPGNSIPAMLPSPSPAVPSASCRDTAAAAHEGTARVWGDGNFFLSLTEHKLNGEKTGALVAVVRAADEDGSPSLEVTSDFRFSWNRIRASGVRTPVKGIEGPEFLISADDIGACVEVCAVPKTLGGLCGRRCASLGPFQVDLRTKTLVLSALANGGTRFSCTLASPEDGDGPPCAPEVSVDINSDQVIVTFPSSEEFKEARGGNEFRCTYTASLPSIELDPTSSKIFQLRLSEETVFSLKAATRHQRDLLATTLKSFQSRVFVSTSLLLDRVAPQLPCESGEELRAAAQQSDPRVDLYCAVHHLQTELQRSLAVGVRTARDFARAAKEKEALEEEMRLTISAFQTQLDYVLQQQQQQQQGGSSSSSSSWREAEETKSQLEAATAANKALEKELQQLRLLLQQKEAANGGTAEQGRGDHVQWLLQRKAEILAKEKETLERRLAEALKMAEHPRNTGQEKELLSEVKRLRAEVEQAHLDKSRVSLQLSDVQRCFEEERRGLLEETQQLRDELLHAEARAECLAEQVTELRAAETEAETLFTQRTAALHATTEAAEKETAEIKRQLEAALGERDSLRVERNRLLKLNDSLSKDLERSKVVTDQAAAAVQKLTHSKQQLQQEAREQLQQQMRESHRQKEEMLSRLQAAETLAGTLRREKIQLEGGVLVLQQQQQQLQQQLQQQQQQMQQQQQQLQHQQKIMQQQQQQLQQHKEQQRHALEAAEEAATRPSTAETASRDAEETARLKAENESLKARLRKLGRPRGPPLASGASEEGPLVAQPKIEGAPHATEGPLGRPSEAPFTPRAPAEEGRPVEGAPQMKGFSTEEGPQGGPLGTRLLTTKTPTEEKGPLRKGPLEKSPEGVGDAVSLTLTLSVPLEETENNPTEKRQEDEESSTPLQQQEGGAVVVALRPRTTGE